MKFVCPASTNAPSPSPEPFRRPHLLAATVVAVAEPPLAPFALPLARGIGSAGRASAPPARARSHARTHAHVALHCMLRLRGRDGRAATKAPVWRPQVKPVMSPPLTVSDRLRSVGGDAYTVVAEGMRLALTPPLLCGEQREHSCQSRKNHLLLFRQNRGRVASTKGRAEC